MTKPATPPQPRTTYWIDVRDHLPDDELLCLVASIGRDETDIILGYHEGGDWFAFNTHGTAQVIDVTHWKIASYDEAMMYLSEQPKVL